MDDESLKKIVRIISKSDWGIAVPNGDDDDEVVGFIVGTDEYIKDILIKLEGE